MDQKNQIRASAEVTNVPELLEGSENLEQAQIKGPLHAPKTVKGGDGPADMTIIDSQLDNSEANRESSI